MYGRIVDLVMLLLQFIAMATIASIGMTRKVVGRGKVRECRPINVLLNPQDI